MDKQTEITRNILYEKEIIDKRIFELLCKNVKSPVSINLAICNWDDLLEFLKKRLQT